MKKEKVCVPVNNPALSRSRPPVILTVENKTAKIQEAQLFHNQSIPKGVIVSSGLSGVSIDSICDHFKIKTTKISRLIVQKCDSVFGDKECFIFRYGIEYITGLKCYRPIILIPIEGQINSKMRSGSVDITMDFGASLNFEINPKSKINILIYMSDWKRTNIVEPNEATEDSKSEPENDKVDTQK